MIPMYANRHHPVTIGVSQTDQMQSLIDEIKIHFPVHPVPRAVDAIVDTYMVEHLHEILGDRLWPTLTPTECRHCSDGFNFLTPSGLHYYLPAYMTAEVIDHREADVVIDALIGLFQGDRSFGREEVLSFWQLMTPGQLIVVGRWIDHYETRYHFNDCTTTEVHIARKWVAAIANSNS